jgi:hypothetical protein
MKVYRISKWAFGGICLLILLLPVSRHWKLLTSGERTTGEVTGYGYRMVEDKAVDQHPVKSSEIEFEADGKIYKTYGPVNYEYKQGRSLTIIYKEKDPDENCIATFTGFYLNYYTAIPIVLLAVWYAFYLSFNNYRKRNKDPKFRSGTPGGKSTRKAFQNSRRLPLI